MFDEKLYMHLVNRGLLIFKKDWNEDCNCFHFLESFAISRNFFGEYEFLNDGGTPIKLIINRVVGTDKKWGCDVQIGAYVYPYSQIDWALEVVDKPRRFRIYSNETETGIVVIENKKLKVAISSYPQSDIKNANICKDIIIEPRKRFCDPNDI